MGELLKGQFGQKARQQKNKRSSLCANGHHRWRVVKQNRFDVKQGKLITERRCQRCGVSKTTAE